MLKQLKLRAELKAKKLELAGYETQRKDFATRKADLEQALIEAESDEDIKLVESQIDELESEVNEAGIEGKAGAVQTEITRIETELDELEKPEPEGAVPPDGESRAAHKEGEVRAMNKYQIREMIRTGEYYKRAEVKEFYEKFRNLRAVGGEELTIPETIVNRIFDIMGDYDTLYPIVDTIRVKGTTRILIDTDTSAATWVEMTGTLETGTVGTISKVDFDGYKLGKVTFVDNAMLQDSIINLDDYVTRKLARAMVLGINLAILKGTGVTGKQMTGIIPSLDSKHKTEALAADLLKDALKKLALIDTGADTVGEIVAVMKRSTYYNRFVEYTINVDSAGNVVGKLPNLTSPNICGIKVVFSQFMDEDTVLFGDFRKYTIVERESVTIGNSEHVKYLEDQMTYRIKGRFDGKPTNAKAFVMVNIDSGALETLMLTSAAGAVSGKTVITVAEAKPATRTYQYKTNSSTAPTANYGDVLSGWTAWDGVSEIDATSGHKISVAEVGADGKVKKLGSGTVVSAS